MNRYNINHMVNWTIWKITWKRRKAVVKNKNSIKTPESYIYLNETLKSCLSELINKKRNNLTLKFKYLEVSFFKNLEDLESYFNDLSHYWIEYTRIYNNKVYFYLDNIDLFISYISTNLVYLEDYINENISEDDFLNKQIILWKYFKLNDDENKSYIINYIRKFDQVKINYISTWNKKDELEVYDYINKLSTTYSWISIDIYDSTIFISDIVWEWISDIKDFIMKLSLNDKILSIRLDSYFWLSDGVNWLSYSENNNIEIIEPEGDLPVVAILDTWISKNYFTSPYLIDEWLDYTSKDWPLNWDPFNDSKWHWTKVANQIIYWNNIEDYFLDNTNWINSLYPSVKVLSVKVLDLNDSFINYWDIFKIWWIFSELIIKYNIKVINISINELEEKDFLDDTISSNASILDKFANYYWVTFSICAWNIEIEDLKKLIFKYPNFDFFQPWFIGSSKDIDKKINISSPADNLSWITVWWAYHHKWACYSNQDKCYNTSLFSRWFNWSNVKGFYKPDLLSIWSGDLLLSNTSEIKESSKFLSYHIWKDETQIVLDYWTSFSAPRVARAIAIWAFRYPNFSISTIKWLFLHNLYTNSKNKIFYFNEINNQYEKRLYKDRQEYFSWNWLHIWKDEYELFIDTDNKITFVIEWNIKSWEINKYSIPISKMISRDSSNKKYNKLKLKLSICFLPTNNTINNNKISLLDANEFYISWCIHKNNFDIVDSKWLCFSKWKAPNFKKEILLNWTMDYFKVYNKTYSSSEDNILKKDLLDILSEDDTIILSVRWLNKKDWNETKDFSAIFSVEDLWETNTIRNSINIDLTI